jgi:UDP-glucose 4,6-dehydratase
MTVMDKGLQSRCYLFVCDAVNALDTILHGHNWSSYDTYNISSTQNYTTLDVSMKVLSAFGYDVEGDREALTGRWVTFVPDRPFHDMHYFTTCQKLTALGWKQRVLFDEGLALTVEWYKTVSPTWWQR